MIFSNGFSAVTVTLGSLPPAAFTRIVGAPSASSIFLCASAKLARELASHSKKRRVAAGILDGLDTDVAAFLVAAKHGDFCACPSETFRQRAAQHARAADDHRHFAFE